VRTSLFFDLRHMAKMHKRSDFGGFLVVISKGKQTVRIFRFRVFRYVVFIV
jgi:hypothetical protein